MPNYKVGDHLMVKLSGGRIVEATVKAIVDMKDGVRLQVSFGDETALIYLQIPLPPRRIRSQRASLTTLFDDASDMSNPATTTVRVFAGATFVQRRVATRVILSADKARQME